MTRLIDADELHEILNWTMFKPPFSKKQVRRFIDDSRTVDAIPVIRCKDCKYYSCGTIEGKHLCMSVKYRFAPTTEDEWCSRAERKEE